MKLRLMLLSMFFFFQAAHATNADNISREGPKTYHVYDDVELISSIKFSYGANKIVIKSVFPELIGITANEAIDRFNELVKDSIAEGVSSFKSRVAEVKDLQETMTREQIRNNLYIDYSAAVVTAPEHHIISVRMTFQGAIAGKAHPYHYHRVINFDLDVDQEVRLADLFLPDADYLSKLSEYTQNSLNKNLKYATMIASGTRPVESNFINWNLKFDGILITFDEYQVAPYVYGAQTVLVPFTALRSIIDPKSIIGACSSKKRKRCLQRNLIMGGFIDEAVNTKHGRFYPILSHR